MKKIKNKRLITSYISIVIIMSIVLFLFGFFGVFVISSSSIANSFKENFSISIFFKENAKQIEVSELQNQLLMSDYLEKLTYVSKENAVLIMKEEYGEDFIKDLGYNPLVNSIDINLKSKYVETIKIDSIAKIIKMNKYVDEIVYEKNLITLINENIKKVSFWLVPSIIIFLLITFLIINSSIRLSIYSNRQLIKTMQLVGATKSFIRKPFLKTNALLSLISSLFSISLLLSMLYYLDINLNFFNSIELNTIFTLCSTIILLGFVISYISTYFATQNILKIKADQLDI
jgi:cell division transport system permease protein